MIVLVGVCVYAVVRFKIGAKLKQTMSIIIAHRALEVHLLALLLTHQEVNHAMVLVHPPSEKEVEGIDLKIVSELRALIGHQAPLSLVPARAKLYRRHHEVVFRILPSVLSSVLTLHRSHHRVLKTHNKGCRNL